MEQRLITYELTGFDLKDIHALPELPVKEHEVENATKNESLIEQFKLYKEMKIQAVNIISRYWRTFQQKKVFNNLKKLLLYAEAGFTNELLKKISPKELELLKDPFMQGRIRFRFGGDGCFPPKIYFKVYSKGINVHYFNGLKLIEPGSQAAKDSCDMMGTRKFMEQVIMDEQYYSKYPKQILDPNQVTTKHEYIKYMTSLDHKSSNLGGRDNNWRHLEMDDFPSHKLFYDLTTIKRALVKRTIKSIFTKNKQNLANNPAVTSPVSVPKIKSKKNALEAKQKIKLRKLKSFYGQLGNKDENAERNQKGSENQANFKNHIAKNENDVTADQDLSDDNSDMDEEIMNDEEFKLIFEWSNDLENNNLDFCHNDYKV
ncbi:putative protein CXorf58 [Lobulomyces angularis]|nr:putative protein CXorf58 [Lobulomyces angularis]